MIDSNIDQVFLFFFYRSNYSELPSAEHIQFTLSISSTELEDEGLYTCIAKNDFGSDEKDIRLMLVGMFNFINQIIKGKYKSLAFQ